MADFVIFTDSAADFPANYLKDNSIGVLDFKTKGDNYLPVPLQSIDMAFEPIVQSGKDILFICLSSLFSKSYENIVYIAKGLKIKYPERTVEVIDSCKAGIGESILISYANHLKKEGKSIEETISLIEANKHRVKSYFVVEDFQSFEKGNFVPTQNSSADIRPVFEVNEKGQIVVASKVMGRKKTILELVKYVKNNFCDETPIMLISHIDSEIEAKDLKEKLKGLVNCNIKIAKMNKAITKEIGSQAIAVAFVGK